VLSSKRLAAVTGAFSYSGRYITEALLRDGWDVITLTRRPERQHPLQGTVIAYPLDFSNQAQLVQCLDGVDLFVNTYWVRFNYPGSSFNAAIENTRRLVHAAEAAGVRRFIHLSVSNPDKGSSLAYYRGKAEVESILEVSSLSYAILRPTLIFGEEEVLVNNIAWLLRRLPVFAIPGNGAYRLEPIYAGDLAELVVQAAENTTPAIIQANGPETYTFEELVRLLAQLLSRKVWLLRVPPSLALLLAKMIGLFLRDALLTREELQGLMEERLYVGEPAAATTRFSDWARQHTADLGRRYAHELNRHHNQHDETAIVSRAGKRGG
jgi:NADH dehydrogenase